MARVAFYGQRGVIQLGETRSRCRCVPYRCRASVQLSEVLRKMMNNIQNKETP
ncbi:hypothetical protein BamIOP4010DRAFT_4100 [Burkholderia ambifaria IOP40-10]|uniref:Uncharacterized protein n=1 Tax=Burkholderia ambifaria IOP40-10 TaxID=396596 RepID=B1FJ89_9BURK|nr:hypothetical protein BamIOP4010DRAFT_4100 [Burkholderia ambifaria IOP40-10]